MTDIGAAGNLFIGHAGTKSEVTAVPSGLHGEERGIQAQAHQHEKDVLIMGQERARCGHSKIR